MIFCRSDGGDRKLICIHVWVFWRDEVGFGDKE